MNSGGVDQLAEQALTQLAGFSSFRMLVNACVCAGVCCVQGMGGLTLDILCCYVPLHSSGVALWRWCCC